MIGILILLFFLYNAPRTTLTVLSILLALLYVDLFVRTYYDDYKTPPPDPVVYMHPLCENSTQCIQALTVDRRGAVLEYRVMPNTQ